MFKAYLINLPWASERLAHVTAELKRADIALHRVDAVVGKELSLPHPDFAERSYRLRAGRRPNLSELGCYFSHIKALEDFLQSEDEFGLILEDDVSLPSNLKQIIHMAIESDYCFDFLQLSGYHRTASVTLAALGKDHVLRCDLTQQTGAGAYLVSRFGAKKLCQTLRPMKVAYDHAFNRDWVIGIKSLAVHPLPVNQYSEFDTQIGGQSQYRLPEWQRKLTVPFYRIGNEISRFFYRLWVAGSYKLKRSGYYKKPHPTE